MLNKAFNEEEIQVPVLRAIKNKCLYDCCAGDVLSHKNCTCTQCWLFPFRFGKNPYRNRKPMTEEQKDRLRQLGFKKKNINN